MRIRRTYHPRKRRRNAWKALHKGVPYRLSKFEWREGRVAYLRLREPGHVLMRLVMRSLRGTK